MRGEPGMPRSVAAGDDTFDTASDGSCVGGGQARVLDGGIRGAAVGLAGNSGYQRASTDIGALYGVGSRQCPRVRTPLAGHGAVRVEWNQGRSRVRRASATKRPHPAPVLRLPGEAWPGTGPARDRAWCCHVDYVGRRRRAEAPGSLGRQQQVSAVSDSGGVPSSGSVTQPTRHLPSYGISTRSLFQVGRVGPHESIACAACFCQCRMVAGW